MTIKNNWEKNLIFLCVSQFFYRAGSRSLLPFLPLYIKSFGTINNSQAAVWSGWILSIPFIVSFLTTPFWGSIGDKYGRKLSAILAVTGFILSQYAMGLATSLTFLLLASSLQEILGGAYPAAVSLTAANSPEEKTTDALSYLQFSNALGNIVGPILGGLLADAFGFRMVFFIVATSVLVFSFPILFLIDENVVSKENQFHSMVKNLRYFIQRKNLILYAILLLAYTLSITIMRPSFALFVQSNFNESKNYASTAGILLGILGVASSISTLFLPWLNRKFNIEKNIFVTFISAGILFLFLHLPFNIYLFAIIIFLTGIFTGIILPLVYSLISFETCSERKAGVMGVGSSFQMIGNLLGPVVAGYLVFAFGIGFPFIASGSILLIAIFIYKRMV